MTDFEQFIHDYGYKYTEEETMKAAYDRAWKAQRGIALTENEFVAEVEPKDDAQRKVTKETFSALLYMVEQKKMSPSKIYQYAHFRWCLHNAEAVVAYKIEGGKWEVNNCEAQISTEQAVMEVNSEWGFEASRVKIIGTPYYDASDWMFIRFDCAHMNWLYANGNLYKVYA